MACSVGNFIGESCSADLEFIFISSWPADTQEIFFRRVRHERSLAVDSIVTSCSFHANKFGRDYDNFQKREVGCCNLFSSHTSPIFQNTRRVTEDIRAKCIELDIDIVVGRQICIKCYQKLMRQFDGEFEECDQLDNLIESPASFPLPEEYTYAAVQTLYESTLPREDNSFEKVLKPCQAEAIYYILKKRDVLCILPTNYGKTLPMIMSSYILSKTIRQRCCSLIISPLKTLMADLSSRLKKYNLKSVTLTHSGLLDGSITKFLGDGVLEEPIYIIASPEILKLPETRYLLTSQNICHIMVDECHLSFEWGKHFRTDYANIHEVRQYLGCPLGLFTATLSHVARSEVISNTGLKKDMAVVSANPDRPEIFLELRKREDFEKSLDFVVSDCQGKGRNASKTLVFVNSINKTHNFNFNLRRLMHDKGRVRSDEGKILGYISEHFSSVIDPKSRNRIIKDFSEEDGIIRTLFSTVSYGLGIDNPFINTVVIYDTDKTKSSLWQKISRGCRGGQNGKAIILSTSDKPRSNSFFKPDICMRHTILSGFAGYKKPASHPKCEGSKEKCGIYMCCSTCRSSCKCEEVMVVEEVEDMNFTQSHFQPSEYPSHGQYENFGIGHSHYENIFD